MIFFFLYIGQKKKITKYVDPNTIVSISALCKVKSNSHPPYHVQNNS